SSVELLTADIDVFHKEQVVALRDNGRGAAVADMDEQGAGLAIVVTAALRGVAADKSGRLDIDGDGFESRPFNGRQRLVEHFALDGKNNYFAERLIALSDVGGFDIAQFGLVEREGDAAGRFLRD